MAKHVEAIRSSFLTLLFGGMGWEPLPVLTCPSTTHQKKGCGGLTHRVTFLIFITICLYFLYFLWQVNLPTPYLSTLCWVSLLFKTFCLFQQPHQGGGLGLTCFSNSTRTTPCFKQVDGMVWRVDVFATSTCAM